MGEVSVDRRTGWKRVVHRVVDGCLQRLGECGSRQGVQCTAAQWRCIFLSSMPIAAPLPQLNRCLLHKGKPFSRSGCPPRRSSCRGPTLPHLSLFSLACRDDLLPQGLDVNPALEAYPDFVRDMPSPVSTSRVPGAWLTCLGTSRGKACTVEKSRLSWKGLSTHHRSRALCWRW